MNVQFAIKDDIGLRARSEPARLAHRAVRLEGHRRAAGEVAARVMAGKTLAELGLAGDLERDRVFVKVPVFPSAVPGRGPCSGPR